ncbi:hypothetical protein F53441_8548 [Fusarium austroafricanum]|uniref:Uncharacterized protein n=1 Tax=Fusarium austroafricanum TaxID=2364996 RepID=A0A8H4KEU0_9HYPO|nr:hypothetical protein F53441_8548 [Fusarium austroafricanum]
MSEFKNEDFFQALRLTARQLQRFYEATHDTGRHFSSIIKPHHIQLAAQLDPVYSAWESSDSIVYPQAWHTNPGALDFCLGGFQRHARAVLRGDLKLDTAPEKPVVWEPPNTLWADEVEPERFEPFLENARKWQAEKKAAKKRRERNSKQKESKSTVWDHVASLMVPQTSLEPSASHWLACRPVAEVPYASISKKAKKFVPEVKPGAFERTTEGARGWITQEKCLAEEWP